MAGKKGNNKLSDEDRLDSLMTAVEKLTQEVKDTKTHIDSSAERLERGWEAQLERIRLSIETKHDEAIAGLREEMVTSIKEDIVREAKKKAEEEFKKTEKDLRSQYTVLRNEMDTLRLQLTEAKRETKRVS